MPGAIAPGGRRDAHRGREGGRLNAHALAPVVLHPRMTGTVADRVAIAEGCLVVEARRLAESPGLADVRSLLTGAATLAEAVDFEEARR